ncbi:MAG: hypothetical protein AAF431_14135 [Pseudomonadota bacterium]
MLTNDNTVTRSIRLLIAVVGGYLFTDGFIGLIGVSLPYLGWAQSEALNLAILLGLLAYVIIMIWAISTVRLLFTTVAIFASSAAMIYGAPLLVQA